METTDAGVNAGVKLSPAQVEIFEMLLNDSCLSQAAIAKKLKTSETTVYRNIKKLKLARLLERQDLDKAGIWIIKNHNP